MKTLYIECFSGISGDMTIGALIDLGADVNYLKQELSKLNLSSEYELKWEKVVKNGISATKFDVCLKHGQVDDHHHHAEGDHGVYDHHHHDHVSHAHSHDHHHDQHHNPHGHHHDPKHFHGHHHRHLTDIINMIHNAEFNENVTKIAIEIFQAIGRAEAKIHNMSIDEVHFHEVGAVDSIIDIVGTAILLDQLKVERIQSSSVPVGSGRIQIDHGVYPIPAPATLELLKDIPIQASPLKGELTTPTGAGILSVLVEEFSFFPSMTVEAIGYGAGTKSFPDHPNVLRMVLGTID